MTDSASILSISIAGLEFRNPVFLASGILDETGASMARVARLGAGAVVTKSIGLEPRIGHPNPTVAETPCGLLNAMGLPNPGMQAYREEIEAAAKGGVPVIASIYGSSPDEFGKLASMARDAGASALELNLSCPHAKGLGLEMGQDPVLASDIIKACKTSGIPVFPKISPHVNNLGDMAEAFMDAGASGVVAINTLRGMAVDVEARMPILGNKVGGLSGPAIKPVGLRVVYELYNHTGGDLPIIGVGGITSGRDALEYIMAGATAVEVGTAVLHWGAGACGEIARELMELLKKTGYGNVGEAIGVIHRTGKEVQE